MSRVDLEVATIEELVAIFAAIAVNQNAALECSRNAEYNRLYRQMEKIEEQLKARGGDQRRALLPLYGHPNRALQSRYCNACFCASRGKGSLAIDQGSQGVSDCDECISNAECN